MQMPSKRWKWKNSEELLGQKTRKSSKTKLKTRISTRVS
jgi:hypothetical protein